MSYDYGKSFKKMSERFSFGGGNGSEVAIAQFYHSPADNKRVRTRQSAPAGLIHRLSLPIVPTQHGPQARAPRSAATPTHIRGSR